MIKPLALSMSALLLLGCDNGRDACCADLPAGGLYATFTVGTESFNASITHPDGMAQVRAVWSGSSDANIPVGELVCTPVAWNAPWRWHLAAETVRMAEVTAEVCDGAPSYVDANCSSFGAGRYCPWTAELTALRDCSVDPSCPALPR